MPLMMGKKALMLPLSTALASGRVTGGCAMGGRGAARVVDVVVVDEVDVDDVVGSKTRGRSVVDVLTVVGVVIADVDVGGDNVVETVGTVANPAVVVVNSWRDNDGCRGCAAAEPRAGATSRPTARTIHNPTTTRASALAIGPVCHGAGPGWTTTAARSTRVTIRSSHPDGVAMTPSDTAPGTRATSRARRVAPVPAHESNSQTSPEFG